MVMRRNLLKIGDKIKDIDNTIGVVVETAENGNWIRYKCRPYLCPANLICNPKLANRVRLFWNMRKNLKKI